jgi:hypothetical protein
MVGIKNRDLSVSLLWFLHDRVPAPLVPWSLAMLSELSVIDGFWPRLQWSLGSATALLTAGVRHSYACRCQDGWRPDVPLIAGYEFLFSAQLIGLLTWQLPRLTESWRYAIPALIMSYGIAALPGLLGFALWLRDAGARIGIIGFSIAHILLNLEYISRGAAPHPALTTARIAIDSVIILALCRPSLRREFQLTPLALQLRDETPERSCDV